MVTTQLVPYDQFCERYERWLKDFMAKKEGSLDTGIYPSNNLDEYFLLSSGVLILRSPDAVWKKWAKPHAEIGEIVKGVADFYLHFTPENEGLGVLGEMNDDLYNEAIVVAGTLNITRFDRCLADLIHRLAIEKNKRFTFFFGERIMIDEETGENYILEVAEKVPDYVRIFRLGAELPIHFSVLLPTDDQEDPLVDWRSPHYPVEDIRSSVRVRSLEAAEYLLGIKKAKEEGRLRVDGSNSSEFSVEPSEIEKEVE